MFNDDWMRKMGYLDTKGMTAADLVASKKNIQLITIDKNQTIGDALKLITENNFSQIPVTSDDRIVGSIYENLVFNKILQNGNSKNDKVESIMQEALPFIDISTPLDDLSKMISGDRNAVLVKDFKANSNFIITKFDIVEALAR
jgi:cystathionine beta-synthase